jgi:hypothetical protein
VSVVKAAIVPKLKSALMKIQEALSMILRSHGPAANRSTAVGSKLVLVCWSSVGVESCGIPTAPVC